MSLKKILFNGSCVNLGTFNDVRNRAISQEEDIVIIIKTDKFESELKVGENKDKIEFEIASDSSVEFKLKYKTETESTEIEMKFKVKF